MDREKVIKAAEICLRYIDDGDCPTECPYFDLCTKYEKRVVFQPLIRDALALLKEQENLKEKLLRNIADNQLAVSPTGYETEEKLAKRTGEWNGLQMAYEIVLNDGN